MKKKRKRVMSGNTKIVFHYTDRTRQNIPEVFEILEEILNDERLKDK
jgi:hypothetical protein